MPTGIRFTLSDYIAMMQHYSAVTNFLDWTENAFTSLYMALKYFFTMIAESEESNISYEGKHEYRNVTLSLFHPGIYNKIRRDSLQKITAKKWMNQECFKKNHYLSMFSNQIPNLSTRRNEEMFDMFLTGDLKFEEFYATKDMDYLKSWNTSDRDFFMPMAILTSRLNSRIRTQCGCFVAYNLYTPPKCDKSGNPVECKKGESLFDYISLEEIQKCKIEEGIFLYQIVIDKKCCEDVAKWLESLGVSRENVYPELSEKAYRFQ